MTTPLPVPPPVPPALYLISRPALVDEGINAFKQDLGVESLWSADSAGAGEAIAELAGRLDYMSFDANKRRPGGAAAYFPRILAEKHTNIIENSHWVTIWRLTQGSARDLMRYRTAERSQTSTRYVDYAQQPVVLTPGYDEAYDPVFDAQWREAYQRAYTTALARGKQQGLTGTTRTKFARDRASRKIPFEIVTWCLLTTNLQTARHIIQQRANPHVRPDLRYLAVRFFEVLSTEAPHLFGDMELFTDSDGQDSVRLREQG